MDWLAFKTPERLWVLLVLPALVIAYLVLMRLKGRTALRFTNTGVLGRVIGSQRLCTLHLADFMSLGSLSALLGVGSAARNGAGAAGTGHRCPGGRHVTIHAGH